MPNYRPYSYSRLSLHDQCPRKFKYSYIDKLERGPTDRTALLKGGAVHSILENYPNRTTHKLAHKYHHIVDKFLNGEVSQKYFGDVSFMNEVSFGLTEELEPTTYGDKKALFRGKIDRVQVIDNLLYLCDWKTGKYREERFQDFRQLLFYAIYFFRRYPNINKIKICYVYVEHDLENEMILDREYLFNYVKQLTDIIIATESDREFPKSPSRLCDWCDYQQHCAKDI